MFWRKPKPENPKIEDLAEEIRRMKGEIREMREKEHRLAMEIADAYLEYLPKWIGAMADYLNIELKWEWQDDPNYSPPEPKKIMVWKAIKRPKKKNN